MTNSAFPAPIRDLSSLQAALAAGQLGHYLYFWGHTAKADSLGKECFSQWYPAAFELDGYVYPTAEHYMMAEKARLFQDEATRAAIITAKHPNDAKKLGRQIKNFDEAAWLAARFAIVVRGNLAKFSQHPELRKFLVGTGSQILVEASPVDTIWGIGLVQDHPAAADPSTWRGLNLLGFALMEVRDQLAD
ncbi:NADAR family protein [Hymenobacter cellulosilyticus]|uniref:NADAR family protein n=1 Tax=Hymenobacter cellulosilyticus TaxID=2932248 RepID=A0A8T9QCM6_9BACT|nr:NADAR family protein [Hymenobacter cellulosilyticus]UOQ73319.1 NADAR family protein [Hymenobacter cellulosilyticus]